MGKYFSIPDSESELHMLALDYLFCMEFVRTDPLSELGIITNFSTECSLYVWIRKYES